MKVLVCDDDSSIELLIRKILRDAEMLANEPKPNIEIIQHDYGWYRKFEKKSKKRNLK